MATKKAEDTALGRMNEFDRTQSMCGETIHLNTAIAHIARQANQLGSFSPHHEIVRLDVAVEEILRVHILNARNLTHNQKQLVHE